MHGTTLSRTGFRLPDWRPLTEYERIALKMFVAYIVIMLLNLVDVSLQLASPVHRTIMLIASSIGVWNTWPVIAHYLNTRHEENSAPMYQPVVSRGWLWAIGLTALVECLTFLAQLG